jgi:hypothetical protein
VFDDPAFDDSAFDDPGFEDSGSGSGVNESNDFHGFDEAALSGSPYGAPAFGDPIFGDYAPGTPPLAALADQFARRLPELAFEPGLVAAVDQHSAAIRDAIYEQTHTRTDGTASLREALTDYVLGFTDALREMGWHTHEGYDFATLRLTAVCHFMREYGVTAAD